MKEKQIKASRRDIITYVLEWLNLKRRTTPNVGNGIDGRKKKKKDGTTALDNSVAAS